MSVAAAGVLLVLLMFVLVNEDATQISFLGLDFTTKIFSLPLVEPMQ